jgi:anti-sigma factor RsiW
MTTLDDETLMRFADGLLDAPEGSRVKQLVAKDAALRARLDAFRATGRDLARLFDAHLSTPVPPRLLDAAAQAGPAAGTPPPTKLSDRRRPLARAGREWRSLPAAWQSAALAASVAVVAGIGLGWLLHGAPNGPDTALSPFVQLERQRLLASGPLQTALESAASGSPRAVALADREDARLLVKMTFQNEAGDYCRQYEIAAPSRERIAGVACRVGGQWSVAMQAVLPPSVSAAERTVPADASQNGAMDAAIGAIIAGDPVVGDQEAAIIRNGWRK